MPALYVHAHVHVYVYMHVHVYQQAVCTYTYTLTYTYCTRILHLKIEGHLRALCRTLQLLIPRRQ